MENKPPLRLLDGGEKAAADYVRDEGHLVFYDGLVEVPDYFVVVQDGVVIGSVVAQFDFENLHPEYHQTALNWLLQNRVRLGALSRNEPEKPPPSEEGFIRRIRGWLGLS